MQTCTQIINPLSDEKWDQRLGYHERLIFFHSQAWAQVLSETYNYRPLYVCTLNGDSIVNLLPMMEVKSVLTGKRGVSLPFTDYCEPILTNGMSLEQILEDVRKIASQHGWKWFQIRGGQGIDAAVQEQYCVHELRLQSDMKALFKSLRSAKQRNIRKARQQQIEIQHANDKDAVDAYYRLHCQTRKRHGIPPQPYRFFHNIYKYVISADKGKVILAQYQDRVIAGCMYFHFKDKALYKFGASNMAFQHLRPNDLVMWEAIQWYAANGYKSFCFGRTAKDNTGLRRFKSDWGAQERMVNYYRYDMQRQDFIPADSVVKSAHKRFFQSLPVPALKLFGTVLYKHIG